MRLRGMAISQDNESVFDVSNGCCNKKLEELFWVLQHSLVYLYMIAWLKLAQSLSYLMGWIWSWWLVRLWYNFWCDSVDSALNNVRLRPNGQTPFVFLFVVDLLYNEPYNKWLWRPPTPETPPHGDPISLAGWGPPSTLIRLWICCTTICTTKSTTSL